MDPDIESLLGQYAAVRLDMESVTANLSEAQFLWKPGANKWSIAECLAHLVVVDGTDLPGLRESIGNARAKGITGHGPFQYGLWSGWFVKSMDAPVKRFKVSAPGAYLPHVAKDPRETLAELLKIQNEVTELVKSADGLDLARVKVRLPIGPGLKMSLGRRFQLLAAHDRRHFWQARQVIQSIDRSSLSASST